jgi:hypothetical protein
VLQWATFLGMTNAQGLLLPITLGFAAAAIAAGAIRLLTLWLNGRLAAAIGSDLSSEAYRRTLYQPYLVHVTRNSSGLIATISGDVGNVIWPSFESAASAIELSAHCHGTGWHVVGDRWVSCFRSWPIDCYYLRWRYGW